MLEEKPEQVFGLVCKLAVGDGEITLPGVKGEAGFGRLVDGVPCAGEAFQRIGKSGAGRAKTENGIVRRTESGLLGPIAACLV
jgi:hypothetical protein